MSKTKSTVSSLSAFIPCFNEEANVEAAVTTLIKVIQHITPDYEIIIIDDGSRDRTASIARQLAKDKPQIHLVSHATNLGYGAALRSGFRAATKEWVFFTDGDLQFDVSELAKFIPYTQTYNVVIGYRTSRAEGGIRALNARLFKLFIDILFRVHVKDIDCAFKLFKTQTIKSLPLTSTGAMISAEILYRLKKKNILFKQLPVKHYPRRYGSPTGANFKVILRAVTEALRLYLSMKFNLLKKY